MTEQGNGGDGGSSNGKPPEGVLADAALSKEDPRDEAAAAIGAGEAKQTTPPPTTLPVDPNYVEPIAYARFVDVAEKIQRDPEGFAPAKVLIGFMLDRIKQLEDGILPFAASAMVMSNARMCLIADGRADEPAGGTWFSNVKGITLQPNEGLYYSACDAMGRERVQEHVVAVFERLQEAKARQAEKDQHVEAGGTVQ